MNSLERVQTAIRRHEPDRVPVFEFMIDPRVVDGILPGGSYLALVEALDLDVVVTPTPSRMYSLEPIAEHEGKTIYRTEWGEERMDTGQMVTIPYRHPIHSRADWERYRVPDPDKPGRLDGLRELVRRFKGRRAIGCHLHDSFNYPSYLMGMDGLFVGMMTDPGWIKEIIQACNAHCVRMTELAVEAGADFVLFGDDVGGKSGPLVSPSHYREFYLPGLAAVADKARSMGAMVVKHTDGNVTKLLDMFVDSGVQAFHPSDPSAGMDIVEIKRMYGDRLALCGGMDTGDPLSHWGVPDVVREVRRRIESLAPGGGWLIASSNTIHASVRPENYHAMVTATQVYGRYGSLGRTSDPQLEATIGKIPLQSTNPRSNP